MEKSEIIRNYSPATLAYIGDAAWELMVRDHLVRSGQTVNVLHLAAKNYVSAAAQSEFMTVIEPLLTEQEAGVYRRGRNAKIHSHPKNVNLIEYHRATGFEALFGFLHLANDQARLQNFFECILSLRAN